MTAYFDWGSDLNVAQAERFYSAEEEGLSVQASFTSRPYYNWELMWKFMAEARQSIAKLINAKTASRVVLTQGTMEGMMRVFNVLLFDSQRFLAPGDAIATTDMEISATYRQLYPTFNLCVAKISEGTNEDEMAQIVIQEIRHAERPIKAFFLSHVAYCDGRKLPVETLIPAIREHFPDIKIIVDGAQAVGNVRVNIQKFEPDFYLFDFHKWIQGPNFTGAIHCRDEATTLLMVKHATHPMAFDRSFDIEATLCSKYGPLPGSCAALPAAIDGFLSGVLTQESFTLASELRTMIRENGTFRTVLKYILPESIATSIVTLPLSEKQRGIRKRLLDKDGIHVAEHWPSIPPQLQRRVPTGGFVRISCSDNWNTRTEVEYLFDALLKDWKMFG
ncbi:MAG: hypothetical protein A2505_11085 [Deltaproteobacteria bacterium RIFOXYD12_FULL_55_16]|nr:MAG: hypothetical protein A2505_11085 [Deltaproteobacteria bacterium RIFOXYD12_FULL_55_16]